MREWKGEWKEWKADDFHFFFRLSKSRKFTSKCVKYAKKGFGQNIGVIYI